MMDNDFRQRIKNMSNYTSNKQLPEFAKGVEHKAKEIIEEKDKKYRKSIQQIMNEVSVTIDVKVNVYNRRKVVQLVFLTSGCNMKKAGSCWNCNYGIKDKDNVTAKRYVSEFEKLLDEYEGTILILGALGSITDDKEFSRDTFIKIIDLALKKGKFNYIYIETHITQIDEELVKYISNKNLELSVNKRKNISFEVGIEDFNPENRDLINKLGVSNQKVLDVYKMLKQYDVGLSVNLIYGFPFQTENERINSMIENVKYVNKNLTDAEIVVFLMSIKDNTIMQHMQNNGFYELPNPWGFVEAIKEILKINKKNNITFSWFGEKELQNIGETKAYCCPECEKLIVNAVKKINSTFDRNERNKILQELLINAKKLRCKDYEKFQEKLKEDARNTNKRKTPKRRLHDYYTYIINEQTGAKVKYTDEPEL